MISSLLAKMPGGKKMEIIRNKKITGHLRIKDGIYYVVLQYKSHEEKYKQTSFCTKLKEKGNKKKALEILDEVKNRFTVWTTDEENKEEKKKMKYLIWCMIANQPFDDNLFTIGKPRKLPTKEEQKIEFSEDMLFTEFLYKWMTEIEIHNIRITTYDKYINKLNHRILPYFRSYPTLTLKNLKSKYIQEFYEYQKSGYMLNDRMYKSLKPVSIHHLHSMIHKALKYAYAMDLIETDIASKLMKPTKTKYEHTTYTKDELEILLDAVKGTSIEYAVKLTTYYGFRRSEVLGLTWDCVDWEKNTIDIKQTLIEEYVNGKGNIKLENKLKTQSTKRVMPLTEHMRNLLLEIQCYQETNKKKYKHCYNHENDNFVITDEKGNLFVPSNFTHVFANFIKKHKLKKIRFHDLRHTCASLLYEANVPLKEIQVWLGHANLSITANIYTHLKENKTTESAAKLDIIYPHKS